MKALLVNIGFVPQVGGSYRLLYEAARRLPAGAVDVLVSHCAGDRAFDRAQALSISRSYAFTLRDPGGLSSILRGRWPRRADKWAGTYGRLRLFAWLGAPAVLLRVIAQVLARRYNLLLAGQALTTGWLAWALSQAAHIPYGTFVYGEEISLYDQRRLAGRLMRMGLNQADWIVACSQATKDATARAGVQADKIHVLLPAVDTGIFRPDCPIEGIVARYGLAGKKKILSVGRLLERKGFDRVIEALPVLRDRFPNLVYLIRGEGPDKARLEYIGQSIGVSDVIRFIDDLAYEDLPALYGACDVFVMPNRVIPETGEQEGFGIVFLEASSCGRPVIGGNSGGATDAIADGQTGFLVDPASVRDLADRISLLLSDPALARQMGRCGRQWVLDNFSWERYAERLWQLMNGRSKGRAE